MGAEESDLICAHINSPIGTYNLSPKGAGPGFLNCLNSAPEYRELKALQDDRRIRKAKQVKNRSSSEVFTSVTVSGLSVSSRNLADPSSVLIMINKKP